MKKILFFSFAFLICIISFSSVSFASTDDIVSSLVPPSANSLRFIFEDTDDNYYATIVVDGKNFVTEAEKLSNENSVHVEFSKQITTHSYFYNAETGKWGLQSSNTLDSFAIRFKSFVYSDVDIYNKDGTVFFSPTLQEQEPTLYQMIQKVTAESLTKESKTMVGTMKILTVCGVGLIALLIGLALFGKVLRPYLPR